MKKLEPKNTILRAKDLADSYMVTWMRVADVTVLSVGALTFSSDPRFSVIHVPRLVEDINNTTHHIYCIIYWTIYLTIYCIICCKWCSLNLVLILKTEQTPTLG